MYKTVTFDHLEAGNSFSNKRLFKNLKKNPNDNILLPKIGGPESHTSVVVRFGFAMEVTETLSTFHITRSHFPTLPQV